MRVEHEGADVSLLVSLLFVEALLELAVFLEAVLLCHHPLLFLGLEDVSLAAELLQFSAEHLVAAQFALQCSVVERNLDAWAQTNLLEALFAVAQHPRLVALEGMLQSLAYHLVGLQQVGCGDALTVGRVGNHDGRFLGLFEVLEVLECHGDVVGEACRPNVPQCGVHRLGVYVVAIDMVVELALLRVVVVYLVEEVGIEVLPLLEGELLAEESRSHVVGYEGCLDKQCAAAAHGVDEVRLTAPSAHQNDTGGKNLVERCLYRFLAVAASVERLAAGVEAECSLVLGDVYVQTDVGVGNTDIRSHVGALTELVHNGVLHLVSHELRMAELLGEHHRVDGKSLAYVEVLAPVNGAHLVVHVVGTLSLELADGLEDAYGGMQLHVGAIHHFLVTRERHHASSYLYVVGSQSRQFLSQYVLKSHERLGNEFKFLSHG